MIDIELPEMKGDQTLILIMLFLHYEVLVSVRNRDWEQAAPMSSS